MQFSVEKIFKKNLNQNKINKGGGEEVRSVIREV